MLIDTENLKMNHKTPQLLTIQDIVELYKISRSTIYRLIENQKLKVVHIGKSVRVHVEEIENWLKGLSNTNGGF